MKMNIIAQAVGWEIGTTYTGCIYLEHNGQMNTNVRDVWDAVKQVTDATAKMVLSKQL